MYMRPFTTSRMITVRLPPPVLPGRISGSTSPHSSSVRSLGYRNLLRSQRARFWLVHIGDPSSNQATILESQMIHLIQELFGQTLMNLGPALRWIWAFQVHNFCARHNWAIPSQRIFGHPPRRKRCGIGWPREVLLGTGQSRQKRLHEATAERSAFAKPCDRWSEFRRAV